jgi:hypothetical protein
LIRDTYGESQSHYTHRKPSPNTQHSGQNGTIFEQDSYKMALKITPAEKFLLNVQPELRQATQQPRWRNFENNLYKMALKIAPGKKPLLFVVIF